MQVHLASHDDGGLGVKALSDSYSQRLNDPQDPQSLQDPPSSLSSSDAGSDSIPWTIVNRYYTAEVHFETRTLVDFRTHHASEVPAVIYVWNKGEVCGSIVVVCVWFRWY